MKKYYVNVTYFRGFVSLANLKNALCNNKKNSSVFIGHLYNTYKEANSCCSKICDGETEETYSIEYLGHKFENSYDIAIATTKQYKKEYQERYVLKLVSKDRLFELFGEKTKKLLGEE